MQHQVSNDSGIELDVSSSSEKFTVVVEGNIGVGKSTFLDKLQNKSVVDVFPEPVSKWKNVGGCHNLLELMYQDPHRWSGTFQTYAMLTMLENLNAPRSAPVKILERSLYSFRYCFVENLYQSGLLPAVEYEILREWYKWIFSNEQKNTQADLIVYLRSSPETCLERLKARNRSEECVVSLDYLEKLHKLHEDWLIHGKHGSLSSPILVIDADQPLEGLESQMKENMTTILGGFV